jgi:hypothetical protein
MIHKHIVIGHLAKHVINVVVGFTHHAAQIGAAHVGVDLQLTHGDAGFCAKFQPRNDLLHQRPGGGFKGGKEETERIAERQVITLAPRMGDGLTGIRHVMLVGLKSHTARNLGINPLGNFRRQPMPDEGPRA